MHLSRSSTRLSHRNQRVLSPVTDACQIPVTLRHACQCQPKRSTQIRVIEVRAPISLSAIPLAIVISASTYVHKHVHIDSLFGVRANYGGPHVQYRKTDKVAVVEGTIHGQQGVFRGNGVNVEPVHGAQIHPCGMITQGKVIRKRRSVWIYLRGLIVECGRDGWNNNRGSNIMRSAGERTRNWSMPNCIRASCGVVGVVLGDRFRVRSRSAGEVGGVRVEGHRKEGDLVNANNVRRGGIKHCCPVRSVMGIDSVVSQPVA